MGDFPLCVASLRKGLLPPRRQALVSRLFQDLMDEDSQEVPPLVLKQSFDAKSAPSCFVGRKDVAAERKDFCDAVDHFSSVWPFIDLPCRRWLLGAQTQALLN